MLFCLSVLLSVTLVRFVMTLSVLYDILFEMMEKIMQTTRSEKLDLRLTPKAKQMLYHAAMAAHRSVSEFVLESALARAEETLPDRQHFGLNTAQWQAFMTALDAPPRHMPRLERLFNEPSVFEKPSA